MEISFKFNKKDYKVTTVEMGIGTGGKFTDGQAGELELTLEADPVKDAFKDLWAYCNDQKAQAATKGDGTIIVKKDKDSESIEEFDIKQAVFTEMRQTVSRADEKLYMTATLKATKIAVSKNEFEDGVQAGLMKASE
jgi:hypothetical protein